MFSGCALSFLTSFPMYSDQDYLKINVYTKMIYLVKKVLQIAGSFALALCLSRLCLNLVVMAGWWLLKHVSQCLPSCRRRCEGRRDIANVLTIFPCTGCPKSSRVSQNLTIDFSSSGVSSCSFSGPVPLCCALLSRSRKVPYGILYVEAAAQIDGSRPVRDPCLDSRISSSLPIAASLHFTLPMVAMVHGKSENSVCEQGN